MEGGGGGQNRLLNTGSGRCMCSERKAINTPSRHGPKSVGHFKKSASIREEMPRAALDSGSLIISLF